MSNQGKSRKSLIVGIVAAVVVLAVVLVLVLTQCSSNQGGSSATTTAAPATTGGDNAAQEYDLYWNVDRAEYDGKSEAGMSSREPAEDGYFHVRFFKDGEIVELRVADRKTVNALEVQDLMGLEFDNDGIVVNVIPMDDMPCEQIAWQFYVQSVGGKLIKTNSSASLNGMEVLVETNENTGIYDMSGVTGEKGIEADPMQGDRILIVGNEAGDVTHVFIYERPNYMNTHEGECKHCEQTVTWFEWTKESSLPTTSGHYQLMQDLTGMTQQNIQEDAKICFDLNGHRIDGASGRRIWSMHNAGIELAVMDTSEAKNGTIAAHGQGDQGMCIWVRYGVLYFYEGILDGSDATTIKNGTTLNMGNNTYMYMYGGEIIGGTSIPTQNANGSWSAGISGTMRVNTNAKFVMYDGMIRDGYAKGVITKYDKNGQPSSYSAGVGGNIVINGGLMEMHGGTVRDGYARQSGNIHIQGKGEFIMYGGLISNGQCYGKGANGGNVYVSSNCKFTMKGGTIRNGKTFNCGGNLYINSSTVTMTDGIITDGKCYNWTTKEVNDAAQSRNIFNVQGDFYMYGGRVAGGFQCIDSDGKKNETIILVSARSVIFDEDGTGPHLSLTDTAGGTKCIMYVGQLHDEAKIGISKVQAAVFTQPTNVNNTDNFISDIASADVGWTEEGLVIGKVHCLCSAEPNATTHKPGCDEVQYAWAPWNGSSMPAGNANYYLTQDLTLTGGATLGDNVNCRVDLNGYTATREDKYRIYSFLNAENSSLTITDTSAAQTGTLKIVYNDGYAGNQGGIIWGGILNKDYTSQNNTINLIAGTLDASEYVVQQGGAAIELGGKTTLNMYGGTVKGGQCVSKADGTNYHGGSILVTANSTFNMYGGLITGGRAKGGCQGGNIAMRGTMYMYGGTIKDGDYDGSTSDANVRVFNNGTVGEFYMYGGTIAGGVDYNSHGGPAVMYVSGDAVIDKSLTSEGCAVPTISLKGGTTYKGTFSPLQVGELKSGASVYVTPVQPAFSNVTAEANAQYFHSDDADSSVAWISDPANFGVTEEDKGKLFIGHVHCLCGGSIPSGTKLADGSIHTCKNVAFAPADSLSNVNANMNYYLTDDVTATQLKMYGGYTLNLCLNGHNVNGSNKNRIMRSINYTTDSGVTTDISTDESAVNITTCDAGYTDGDTSSNCIKLPTNTSDQNGGIFLIDKGTFTLYRGTLDASQFTLTGTSSGSKYGGAINLTGSGKFVQYPNTTIIGGHAANGTDLKNAHGGAVAVNGDSAHYIMLGGTIKDGKCVQWGGNVHIQNGTFTMYDGLIKGGSLKAVGGTDNFSNPGANVTIRENGNFYMTGGTIDGRIQGVHKTSTDVYLSGSANITSNGSLKGNTFCSNVSVPNIGTLNDDAKIGLFHNGKLGESGKKMAIITDLETFSMDKVGMNVWFEGITDAYTYELRLVGNELWAFETTASTATTEPTA